MKKRWLKWLLVISAALVLLLFGTLLLLRTSAVSRLILNQAQNYLRKNSGIELTASRMRLHLLGSGVTLENVIIRSTSAPDLPPLFKAAKIHARLGIHNTLKGLLDVEQAQVISPEIVLLVRQDGRTNFPQTQASGTGAKFLIARAEATDGSLQLRDLRDRIELTLPVWHLSVQGDRRTLEHHFDFDLRRAASFICEDRSVPISSLRFRGILKEKAVDIETSTLVSANSRLSVIGTINDFSKPKLNLRLEPDLNLSGIARLLGMSEPVRGNLAGTVFLKGEPQNLQMEARGRGVSVDVWTYKGTAFDFTARGEWNSGRAHLDSFAMKSREGSAAGSATFFAGDRIGTNVVDAQLKDLDLYPLWKLLRPPFDFAARSTGKISLKWKGSLDPLKLNASANLTLFATRSTPGRNLLPVSGAVDAKLESGRLTGTLKAFSIMGSRLDGDFSLVAFKTVAANLRGQIGDVDVPLTQVPQFEGNPGNSLIGIKATGPVGFSAQAEGELSNPTIVVSADAPDLLVGDLPRLRVKTDATIRDSRVLFESTATIPQNSTVTAGGVLEFGKLKTVLLLDAQTEQMPAASAISMLGGSIPAEGNLTAHLHLEGPLDNLNGSASVTGDQISVYGEPVGHFDTKLHISGESIQSDPFRIIRDPLKPDTNYVDAGFRYSTNSGEFSFQASGKNLSWRKLTVPGGKTLEGTANLVASGTGTVAHPSIDLRLESEDVRLEQNPLGPATLVAALKDQQADIQTAVPGLGVSGAVHIETQSPYPFNGSLQISDADLARLGFQATNKQPITGTVSAAFQGSGVLKNLEESQLSGQIQNVNLRAGDLEVYTAELVRVQYRARFIELLTPATIVSGNSSLQIAGRIPLAKVAFSGALTLKGQIDLAQAAGFAPAPEGFAAAGTVNLDLSLAGTPQRLTAAGTIQMDNGSVQVPRIAVPFANVSIRARLQDGSLVLDRAEAEFGEARIALQGELPFGLLPKNISVQFPRKEGPARFTLDLTNLRPEVAGILPQGISGLISAHASGQAVNTDLRTLDAQIVFQDLKFKTNEIELSQSQPSTIVIHKGIASISSLALSGTETKIEASGSAGLFRDGIMDLRLVGNFDAGLLTFSDKNMKLAGRTQVRIVTGGTWRAPSLYGIAEINAGRLTLRDPRVVADTLRVRLDLSPGTIAVREFRGTLNGGSLSMTGSVGYARGKLNNFNLKATLQDVFLNFPEGLKSASNGTLTITSSDDTIEVGGNMRILESSYRETFAVADQLMNYLRSQRAVVGGEPSPLLSRIRFNMALRTATPLLVQNNLAKIEANANLRVVGTFYEPSLVGRVTLDQGGEIVLNGRTYYIERGSITLNDQSQVRPELDIEATTRVVYDYTSYDIIMKLTGYAERLSTSLTSEPSLPEQDVISLLLTGRPSSANTQQVARTQALSLIAGQAGEEVTREARQALHLSTFRFDPGGLIASESDLGARLTIGEDITRNFNLAYSMNLTNSGQQIWAGQYKVTRTLTTQATKQEDNSYRLEFRHDLRFGGTAQSRTRAAAQKFTIGSIQFEGGSPVSEKVLLDKLKVKPGDRYDFPKVQKGLDRLHELYAGQGHLEADIRLHRETQQNRVDLDVNINPGPKVRFIYAGTPLPKGAQEKVENAWRNGVFDTERLDDAIASIRRPLIQEGCLQPQITYRVESDTGEKTVHLHVEPGARYSNVPVLFPGAREIDESSLQSALDRANLKSEVYIDPQKVNDFLKQYYRDRGYFQASVDTPQLRLDPKTGTGEVTIAVREGPQFTVGDLQFTGDTAFSYDQLWSVIPTSTGSVYNPASLQESTKALENLYRNKGYNDVSVSFKVVQDPKAPRADVAFLVIERKQSIIRDIVIEGNEGTSRDFVRRQMEFKTGDALDINKIDETRKRLYSIGVYSSVDFQYEEMPAAGTNSAKKDIRVRVRLREVRPYRLQYGLFYDTDRGPGGLLEAQDLNVLGRASLLGMKLRYDSDLKEARFYYNQPYVKNNFLKTDLAAFIRQEDRTAFSARRIGFSVFRQKTLPRKYVFDYGYRYDHVRWNGVPPDPTLFQASVPVARAVATVSRDTRDSILDATRGEFTSHSLEFGPRWLGSEVGFGRYFGQYFRYVPLDKYLGKPTKDKEGRRLPASLVYAGALRLGLTGAFSGTADNSPDLQQALGSAIISPERFFAGGGTTMRGFEQDMLGPLIKVQTDKGLEDRPAGGEAMFLFNNEIRFPIVSVFQGVGFVDLGNVYPRLSDFNFNLRKSAGFGLRIKVKFIPIRFDYGFKLDRRPGESRGAFFFSIGQAF
jgi:outer membrane protein assembly complex protein YaeT